MTNQNTSQAQKELFGMIFMLAQRWQYIGDRELKDSGVTTKQWFLLVTLHALFESPPNLNDLALVMGSSRQNVKQLAINLEKRGFVEIYQDEADKRVQRFRLTAQNQSFWEARAQSDERFVGSLFGNLSTADIDVTHATLTELLKITETL